MKKKIFLKNILFSFIVLIAAFSCLEVTQRIRHPHVGCRGMYNSLGFRNLEFSVEKTPGTIRILFVGSSTTFGSRNNLENTFPFLVGKFLKEELSSKSIEVINAALSARNSFWVAKRIKDTLYLKSDIIIVMTAYNDVMLMTTPKEKYEIIDGKMFFKLPWYTGIHRFFLKHSVFYVTLREKIAILLYGNPEFAYFPPKIRNKTEIKNEQIKECLENYKGNLNKIVQLTSEHKMKLIFLKPPISELRRKKHPSYYNGYQMIIKVLEEVAYVNDIPLIDIGCFLNELEQEEAFITDGIHFTDKANKNIALGIFNYLIIEDEH